MDVSRFGELRVDRSEGRWITPGYTRPKVIENYQKRFSVAYPNEELPAARPFRFRIPYSSWIPRTTRFVFELSLLFRCKSSGHHDLNATTIAFVVMCISSSYLWCSSYERGN